MPLLCTIEAFEQIEGLIMSSRGKRAMEARGLPTAHLGVRLLTPQEGATGVSMFRGLYKARGPEEPPASPPAAFRAFRRSLSQGL